MDWWFVIQVGIGCFGGIWFLFSFCGAVVMAKELFSDWRKETALGRLDIVLAYLMVIILFPIFFVARTT